MIFSWSSATEMTIPAGAITSDALRSIAAPRKYPAAGDTVGSSQVPEGVRGSMDELLHLAEHAP
jgi:hypothetical protein